MRCRSGHQFDIARQGYVTLLGGAGSSLKSDTAAMLSARERALALPQYVAIADAVVECVDRYAPQARTIVEVGAGTGSYLAAVVECCVGSRGLGLDLSSAAAKRIARVHPRVGAIVADVWQPWPVADGAYDIVLSIFSPRNAEECARALAPNGVLVVVTPRPEHLADLIARTGMLGVGDDDKSEQVRRSLGERFRRIHTQQVDAAATLPPAQAADVVMMGPSGFHLAEDVVQQRLSTPGRLDVRVAVTVDVYRLADR